MITPKALIQTDDGPEHAIRVMNKNELSTVYVVDKDLRLAGVLTINDALRASERTKSDMFHRAYVCRIDPEAHTHH